MIELEKLHKELQLMVLLTQNRSMTLQQISERLHVPLRSIYRYLDAFKQMGFIVEKSGNAYRLDRSSPFFCAITQLVHFTESEAIAMRNLLDTVNDHSSEINHLREKLSQLYGHDILQAHPTDVQFAENLHQLFQAIKLQRCVLLKDYRSSRSDSVSDRVVEPFQFLFRNEDVRCYELKTASCKTFKVARMGEVIVLDVKWSHASEHKTFYTDMFHFSGEEQWPVKLRLDRLAAELLKEEYPVTQSELQETEEGWVLQTKVCSWKGIGRFVLGLPGNVEVIDTPNFVDYLKSQPHF